MRKKIFALIAAVAVASVLFAGCGNQKTDTKPEAEASVSEEVSEQQTEAEVDTSAEAEVAEESSGMNVDNMTFEWTDDTVLIFQSSTRTYLIDHKANYYDIYYFEPGDEYELDNAIDLYLMLEDDESFDTGAEKIQKIIDTYFSEGNALDNWDVSTVARYESSAVTYEMYLSEEDEALHVRKMDGENVLEEYDAETSLKLAQKIINDLLPVTVE